MQKCIRMEIAIFLEVYHWMYNRNHILRLHSCITVKLNFQPFIRQFTSLNENFEYCYHLNHPVLGAILKEHCALTMLNMIVQCSPFNSLCLTSIGKGILQANHVRYKVTIFQRNYRKMTIKWSFFL